MARASSRSVLAPLALRAPDLPDLVGIEQDHPVATCLEELKQGLVVVPGRLEPDHRPLIPGLLLHEGTEALEPAPIDPKAQLPYYPLVVRVHGGRLVLGLPVSTPIAMPDIAVPPFAKVR
jgi:hypothetical protein